MPYCDRAAVGDRSAGSLRLTAPYLRNLLPEKSVWGNRNDATRADGADLAEMSPKEGRFNYQMHGHKVVAPGQRQDRRGG